ncbi:MAG TPA: S8 family serine peptidase, partial [bacterium]|nr:S8 family serine peptidase [bacterium]
EQQSIENAITAGCVVVASSGNESTTRRLHALDYPAGYPGVISVGGTTSGKGIAFYSNGGTASGGVSLTLVAPGGAASAGFDTANDIFSTMLNCPSPTTQTADFTFDSCDNNYGVASGTSASAPFVTGGAALILAVNPSLSPAGVSQILATTAAQIIGSQGTWNQQSGWGLMNLSAAVSAAAAATSIPTSTATNSPIATASATATPSSSPTLTRTMTPTATASRTLTNTPTQTGTSTATASPTLTVSPTPSLTPTFTPLNLFTFTPSSTPTLTPTPSPTPSCEIHLWPNPFNPSRAVDGVLKISCLPEGANILFYTLSGEFVARVESQGALTTWKGHNQNNAPVSPGIYYYVIQQGPDVLQSGKILVLYTP